MLPPSGSIASFAAAFRRASARLISSTLWNVQFEGAGHARGTISKLSAIPRFSSVAEAAAPAADEGTALVRVMAASINPSDVKNVAGAMKQTTLPRIPGRDYAGVVEAGPAEWIGAEVWGTGGDVGFTRDGTHAELIAVPVDSLRRKPETLSFDQAASVGVNYMAAWCGIEAAGLKAGETVLLIGAGGGVGGAAAQIARRLGARVIGADRRAPRPGRADPRHRGEADHRRRGPAGRGSCGDRRQGRGCRVRSGRRRHVPQRRSTCLALARPADRNRRDRPARSELRPRRFLSQRKPALRRRHAEARPHGVGQGARCADPGVRRGRLPRRADRRDLRAGRGAGGLSQGRGRRGRAASCCGRRNRRRR